MALGAASRGMQAFAGHAWSVWACAVLGTLCVASLVGCKAPPITQGLPKPPPAAVVVPPRSVSPAPAPQAVGLPDPVTAPIVLRKALPGHDLDTRLCGVATGVALAVARRTAVGSLALELIGPAGTSQLSGAVRLAEPPTTTLALSCDAGGGKVWAWTVGARELAVFDSSKSKVSRLARVVVGVVAQTDGSALVLPAPAGDTAELARLGPDFAPLWQVPVAVPGPIAAMAATLRGDALVVGKVAVPRPQWWLARVFHGDGNVLWARRIDPKQLPTDLTLAAVVASPDGALLFAEAGNAGALAGKWLAYTIDANGGVRPPIELAQRAPRLVAGGGEARVLWAQGRGQGVVVQRAANGEEVAAVFAPWPGVEEPEALSVATDGAWWAVSRAVHADGLALTALVTRWPARMPPALDVQADLACVASVTPSARGGAGKAQPIALAEGSPCGPEAVCRAGLCRRAQ